MIQAPVVNQLIDGEHSNREILRNPGNVYSGKTKSKGVAKKGRVGSLPGKGNGKRDFKSLFDRGLKNIKLDLIVKLEDFIKKINRYIKGNGRGASNGNIPETDRKNLVELIEKLLDKIEGTSIQGNSTFVLSNEKILELIKLIDSLKEELSEKKEPNIFKIKDLIASIEKMGSEIMLGAGKQTDAMSKTDRSKVDDDAIKNDKIVKRKITVIDRRNSNKHNDDSGINIKNVSNKTTHSSETISFFRTEEGFGEKNITETFRDLSGASRDEVSSKNNFQNVMERTREFLANKVFKRGVIVVKENGNGEIRFQLKPEALGSIRMKLTIDENHIVGKIFVENNSVRDVLDNNMDSLRNALKDSGFQTASFEVSVGSQFSDSMSSKNENKENEKGKIKFSAIEEIEKTIPGFWDLNSNDLLVDLTV